MAENPRRRRWLQFGLKSLVLLTVVAGVAGSWWRHRMQQTELNALKEKVRQLESELKSQRRVTRALTALDVDNAEHRRAFDAIKVVSHGVFFPSIQQKFASDSHSRLEVLTFHYDTWSIPGATRTAVLVLRGSELIDLVVRDSSNRLESHDVKLEDVGDTGEVDVVFDCHPGVWSMNRKPFKITYRVSNNGLKQID